MNAIRDITRARARTRARTHLGSLGRLGTLELTCANAGDPTGIIGGIDGEHWDRWTDLRKRHTQIVKPQVTPNLPNNPTPAAKNPTAFPQVNSNNPNNPTHFVSTRVRARARPPTPSTHHQHLPNDNGHGRAA